MVSTKPVPQTFLDFLSSRGLKLVTVYFHNARKGQITAKVETEQGRSVVLKYNLTPRAALQREIEFYEEHRGRDFLPALVDAGKGYLMLEFCQGDTLRQFLATNQDPKRVATVLTSIQKFLDSFYGQGPFLIDASVKRRLVGKFHVLMSSGQQGEARGKLTDLGFALLAKALSPAVYALIPSQEGTVQTIHGDLHPNNILVLEDLSIKVIDWECQERSSPVVDIFYLQAILRKRLGKSVPFQGCQQFFRPPHAIRSLLYYAAALNSRF